MATTPRTIPVVVIVPPNVLLLDIAGPIEVLRRANLEQDRIRFDVRYAGASPQVDTSIGIGLDGLAPLPASLPDDAWIIVAGTVDEPLQACIQESSIAADEAAIVAWLRRTVEPTMTLITICSGAIFAGRAGLLDGRLCTTHFASIDLLSTVAPRAKVRENRLFIEDGNVFTSAGVTAGIDLMLHLVAVCIGQLTALAVARYLVVYLRRSGSDPQTSPWLEGRNHLQPSIHAAQDAVIADPAGNWSVDRLAEVAGTSGRHLSRLFREHTGMSVSAYVTRIRIAAAHDLLVGSDLPLEQVAAHAGFASSRHFRRVWSDAYGSAPLQMRRHRDHPTPVRLT